MPYQHAPGSLIEASQRLCESLPEGDRKTFLATLSGAPPAGHPAAAVPSGIQRALAAGTDLANAFRHVRPRLIRAS